MTYPAMPSPSPMHNLAMLRPDIWASWNEERLDKVAAQALASYEDRWAEVVLSLVRSERRSPARKLAKLRGHTVEVARTQSQQLLIAIRGQHAIAAAEPPLAEHWFPQRLTLIRPGERHVVDTDHCAQVSWDAISDAERRKPPASYTTATDLLYGEQQTVRRASDLCDQHLMKAARHATEAGRPLPMTGEAAVELGNRARNAEGTLAEVRKKAEIELARYTTLHSNQATTIQAQRVKIEELEATLAPSHSLGLAAAVKALQAENTRLKEKAAGLLSSLDAARLGSIMHTDGMHHQRKELERLAALSAKQTSKLVAIRDALDGKDSGR